MVRGMNRGILGGVCRHQWGCEKLERERRDKKPSISWRSSIPRYLQPMLPQGNTAGPTQLQLPEAMILSSSSTASC